MYRILIEGNSAFDNDNEDGLLDGMDNISTKIKPLSKKDIDKANAEIEAGEYVLNPDTLSLHKALGKRHSKGGTKVNIPDSSFIFSDFKDLAFTKKDKKRFEFETGGTKAKNNTPAKILERQLDVKHHNKMINILGSKMQDDIAKASADLMLNKNLTTLGKIAYVQEGKKGFPQGIPPFSLGTAPIYDKTVDTEMTQTTQYMKHGGTIIPKFQVGRVNNQKFDYPDYLKEFYANNRAENMFGTNSIQVPWLQHLTGQTYGNAPYSPELKEYHKWFFQNNPKASVLDFQKAYDKEYYDVTGQHYFDNSDNNTANNFDGKPGNWTASAPLFKHYRSTEEQLPITNIPGTNIPFQAPKISLDQNKHYKYNDRSLPIQRDIRTMETITPGLYPNTAANITGKPITPIASLLPGSSEYEVRSNQGANQVGLSPWQNFNLAYPLLKKASIKSQYPLYQQQQSVVPEQTLMSAQPLLNQIGQDYNQAANLNRVVSPNLSYASNSELFGKKLDASNQAIANVNQANSQIQNQQNSNAAQVMNGDMRANLQFNKQYYDELQTTIQNKERYKDFYDNQFLTNANDMLSKNQAFNNMLNSQRQYKTNKIIGYNNGKPVYAAEPLYLAQQNAVGNSFVYNPNIDPNIVFDQQFAQGDNAMNSQYVKQLQQDIEEARAANDHRAVGSLQSTLARYLNKGIPQQKRGGFIPLFKL